MKMENFKREFGRIRLVHVIAGCAVVFVAFSILGVALLAAGGPWKTDFSLKDNLFDMARGEPVNLYKQAEYDLAGIDSIKITTVSGDVLLAHGGDKVVALLRGTCRGSGELVRLESALRGNELAIEIKYPKRGWGGWHGGCSVSLTVTLPDEYRGDLALATVSGDLRARNLPLSLGKVRIKTVSGDSDFGATAYRELYAETVSGDLTLWDAAAPVDARTVSGDVAISYAKAAETRVKTVSGEVDVALPVGEAFAVDFQSISGEFESNYPGLYVNDTRRSFHGSVGGGGSRLQINTTSGDCELKAVR